MKRSLRLSKETLVALDRAELAAVVGGISRQCTVTIPEPVHTWTCPPSGMCR